MTEVSCPGCGSKLKVPEGMVGKKARCRKCQTSFRVPGPSQPGDSVGEAQMLSVVSTPGIPGDGESVPMASAVEEPEPPATPPARPTSEATSYPSADLLNYSTVPGSKSSPSKAAVPPGSPSAPRSSYGVAKGSPPAGGSTPGKQGMAPGGSSPGKASIGTKSSKSMASPVSPPAKPVSPPTPPPTEEVLSLDDEVPPPPPPSLQAPGSEDPFAFTSEPESSQEGEPKSKKKKKKSQEIDENQKDDEPVNSPSKSKKKAAKQDEDEQVTDPFQTPFTHEPGADTVADPFAFNSDPSPSTKSKVKKKNQDQEDEAEEEKPKSKSKKKSRPQEEDEPEELPQKGSVPVSAPSGDPFAFDTNPTPSTKSQGKKQDGNEDAEEEDSKPRKKKKSSSQKSSPQKSSPQEEDEAEALPQSETESDDEPLSGSHRKYGRAGQKKSNAPLLIAGFLGFLAIGAVIAAIVVFMRKEPDQAKKTEKKDEASQTQPQSEAPKEDAKTNKKDQPKKDPGKRDPAKPNATPSNDPKMPIDPNPGPLVMLKLDPKLPTYTFSPAKVKEVTEGPSVGPVPLSIPFEKLKKFLPPNDKNGDSVVVWQSNSGIKGVSEKMNADVYSQTGAKVGNFDFPADGTNVKCDLSADGKFFAAVSSGKVTIWNLADKSKPIDGFDPYAEKPAHKKAGIAAVYITQNSNNFVTVSTAGAMHLFEIASKNQLGEFIPDRSTAGKLEQGKNVAVEDSHGSIVLAIGGAIYQVRTLDLQLSWKLPLGGDVSRSFGISVAGNPGRIAYVFETDADKKKDPAAKDRAILFCLPNSPTPVIYRWQDSGGVPLSVNWSGTDFLVVGTSKGVVWFEYNTETKQFLPLAMAEHTSDVSMHEATERTHWYLIPMPKDPAKSMLVGIATPISDSFDLGKKALDKKPLETLRLDEKGLWRGAAE